MIPIYITLFLLRIYIDGLNLEMTNFVRDHIRKTGLTEKDLEFQLSEEKCGDVFCFGKPLFKYKKRNYPLCVDFDFYTQTTIRLKIDIVGYFCSRIGFDWFLSLGA